MHRLSTIAAVLAAALVAFPAHAQAPAFTVGTAKAGPGEKATGYIEVPAGVDPGTRIPVVVVHGARPGPVLAMVAGSHGTEYASIIALEKLIPMLDPAQIAGTVIVLPLVNTASFEEKVPHLNPIDHRNMNRMYPGKPDGTQTERASWAITQQVIAQSDYLIDMHGGDLDESLRPYSYWLKIGNPKIDSVARQMVLAFGLRYIIIADDRPTAAGSSRYLDNTAALRGKPSITVEAGYAGTTTAEDVGVLVRGCLNEMRYLKMLPGEAAPVEHPVWFAKVVTPTSDATGIFYPLVKKNTYVSAGMKLGYVTDYFGKTIYEARAPVAGIVLYICAVPSMKKGNAVVDIGVIAPESP
ncbi:MAG TPA: succinylglutamate desuccinylase/aspartoacylase family protein [Candidatus Acidoferrales bacterium]|nr:succinylglutamate desuccinylase/aspartoacylase family protein [Candidatus Acidoferrales bacterium]